MKIFFRKGGRGRGHPPVSPGGGRGDGPLPVFTPALCRADLCLEGVILEGENGWQYHSTVEFRQRLEEFLASPETHEALKRRAAESAEQFSAQRFAQRVERIYQMQLARRAASCVQGVTA